MRIDRIYAANYGSLSRCEWLPEERALPPGDDESGTTSYDMLGVVGVLQCILIDDYDAGVVLPPASLPAGAAPRLVQSFHLDFSTQNHFFAVTLDVRQEPGRGPRLSEFLLFADNLPNSPLEGREFVLDPMTLKVAPFVPGKDYRTEPSSRSLLSRALWKTKLPELRLFKHTLERLGLAPELVPLARAVKQGDARLAELERAAGETQSAPSSAPS